MSKESPAHGPLLPVSTKTSMNPENPEVQDEDPGIESQIDSHKRWAVAIFLFTTLTVMLLGIYVDFTWDQKILICLHGASWLVLFLNRTQTISNFSHGYRFQSDFILVDAFISFTVITNVFFLSREANPDSSLWKLVWAYGLMVPYFAFAYSAFPENPGLFRLSHFIAWFPTCLLCAWGLPLTHLSVTLALTMCLVAYLAQDDYAVAKKAFRGLRFAAQRDNPV